MSKWIMRIIGLPFAIMAGLFVACLRISLVIAESADESVNWLGNILSGTRRNDE